MINNQVQSPVAEKNNVMSGQASGEAKSEAGNQQGGLFKLLMSSVNGETLNGKGGKADAGNILGGNLTLNTGQGGDDKQSALQLLADAGEESKEEKMSLSKLLEGSGSGAGAATDETGNDSKTSGETVAKDSEDGGDVAESDAKTEATETKGESSNGGETGGAEESTQVTGDGTHQNKNTKSGLQETSADGAASGSAVENGTTGEQAAATGQAVTDAQQQAAVLSGDASANQTASQKAGGSDTKGATPINGLVAGQESASGGKIINGEGLTETRGQGEVEAQAGAGRDRVKSEGLVKELQALAAAQGEQLAAGKQERPAPTQLDGSATPEDAALVQEIFSALQSGSIEQVAAEIRSMRASQIRETKYSNYLASFAGRQDISNAGSSLSSGDGSSGSAAQTGNVSTMMPVSTMVPGGTSISTEMFDENGAALWKEQITEYFESKDKSSAENQAAAAFARLGDVPVTNISVRRSFAQGISRAIMNAAGQGNKGGEVWQKHNFVLEDGKNIQVSAREVDGVLQLKLSSSATELNKLLMDHEKEIRELLENELELKIDLQMEGGGDGNAADFFGGSTGQQSNGKGGNNPLDLGNLRRTEEKEIEKVVPQAVRKFGYNQNEWTV